MRLSLPAPHLTKLPLATTHRAEPKDNSTRSIDIIDSMTHRLLLQDDELQYAPVLRAQPRHNSSQPGHVSHSVYADEICNHATSPDTAGYLTKLPSCSSLVGNQHVIEPGRRRKRGSDHSIDLLLVPIQGALLTAHQHMFDRTTFQVALNPGK
jgi:hypothetical protein